MVKSYKKKYISFVLLVCMLFQICIPSLSVAGEINNNGNGINNIYEIKNDTNITMVENNELKCMHGKTQYEPCVECGLLVHSDKNLPLINYDEEFFNQVIPPEGTDEEDLMLYNLRSIRMVCMHIVADGTYCDICDEIVDVQPGDAINVAILDSCVHGKVKGEECFNCEALKKEQDDYELSTDEKWSDPLIYATDQVSFIVAIRNSGFPTYDYECSLCGFYLGSDTSWINNVHHCDDAGCSTWAYPSNQIEIRGTCSSHQGRVILQGGHHLAWTQHYGSGSCSYVVKDTEAVVTTEPTCVDAGVNTVTYHKTCSRCGDTTTSVSTFKIDALGHDTSPTTIDEGKIIEATCQAPGKKIRIDKWDCSRCSFSVNEAETLETYEQLAHDGSFVYKDATNHTFNCVGVNTGAHSSDAKHVFVLAESGEDYFCEEHDNGCVAFKTARHYDAYTIIDGVEVLLKKDVGDVTFTAVHAEGDESLWYIKNENSSAYAATLEVGDNTYQALSKDKQTYSTEIVPGGLRGKVYYEDITARSNYTVEHYKQYELENGLFTYKLADTETGEWAVGKTLNANAKEYEGYELANNQVTSLVMSENSTENVLKLYYNISTDDFSVWVPSAIYIDIDENGNVTVQDNPAVFNAIENRSIAIKEVKLRGVNGWSFSENALELKDKESTSVGTKKLAITLNDDPIKVNSGNNTEATVILTPDNWVIAANSFLPLNIGAVAAAQVQDVVSNHVFTMDFVAGWDKAASSANNYMITLAKSVEGGLADDSIDCVLAIGGNVPTIPDAIPYDSDMKFDGWFISGSDTNIKDVSTINENITIEPRFSLKDGINKLVVNFVADSNGGVSGATTVKVTPGTYWGAVAKPTVTANKGYEFDGWYDADGEKITSMYQILWNQTVTAKFNKIDMTSYFTYDGNKVTGLSDTYLNMVNAPTDLILPTNAGGQTLTEIGVGAFSGKDKITSVVVPDTYTYIHTSAFKGCTNADIFIEGSSVRYWWPQSIKIGGVTCNMDNFADWRYPMLYSTSALDDSQTYNDIPVSYCSHLGYTYNSSYKYRYVSSDTFLGVKSIHVNNLNAINSNFVLAEVIYQGINVYVNEKLQSYDNMELGFLIAKDNLTGTTHYMQGYLLVLLDGNGNQIPMKQHYVNTGASNVYGGFTYSLSYIVSTLVDSDSVGRVVKMCGWNVK